MLNNVRPGFNFASEYTMSGLPHVEKGSVGTTPMAINFHTVTRAITITNNSSSGSYLCVGYTENGVNGSNRFEMAGGTSHRFEVRVRDLWLRGRDGSVDYAVHAELTTIERKNMLPLTGSAGDLETAQGQLVVSGSIIWPGVG